MTKRKCTKTIYEINNLGESYFVSQLKTILRSHDCDIETLKKQITDGVVVKDFTVDGILPDENGDFKTGYGERIKELEEKTVEVKVDTKSISFNEDGELQLGYIPVDETEKIVIEVDKDKNPQVTTVNYKNIDELLIGNYYFDGISISKNGIYSGKHEDNEEHKLSINGAGISLKKGYVEIGLNAHGFYTEDSATSKYLSFDFNKITYQRDYRGRSSLVYPLLKEHLEERVIPVSVNGIFSDNEGNIDLTEVLKDLFNNTSPDGTKWKLGVDNNGNLITTKVE